MIACKVGTQKVFFVENRQNSLNTVLSRCGLLRDHSTTPKDGISINYHGRYGRYGTVDSIDIRTGFEHISIVEDRLEMTFTGDLNQLVSNLNSFSEESVVKVDGFSLRGPWKAASSMIETSTGQKIAVIQNNPNEDTNSIHQTIHLLKKDNGRIINPLLGIFFKAATTVKSQRHSLFGYAHLGAYLKAFKSSASTRSLLPMQVPGNAQYILSLKRIPCKMRLLVEAEENGHPILSLISEGLTLRKNEGVSKEPYVLLSTQPSTISGNKIPCFMVSYGKTPLFVSVLLFDGNNSLHQSKGGIDLLRQMK